MAEYRTVCPLDDLPPGSGRLFEWEGRAIALLNVDGTIYAIDDTCMHAGGPLHEGSVLDGKVICPWHHWEFDLADGSCALNPCHKLDTYATRIIDEQVQVRI